MGVSYVVSYGVREFELERKLSIVYLLELANFVVN